MAPHQLRPFADPELYGLPTCQSSLLSAKILRRYYPSVWLVKALNIIVWLTIIYRHPVRTIFWIYDTEGNGDVAVGIGFGVIRIVHISLAWQGVACKRTITGD